MSRVSVHVGKVALTLCVLALVHSFVVYKRTYHTVPSFRRSNFWARCVHTVANIWLVSPFTSTNNSHINDDSAQERSLLYLHCVENAFLIVSSRIYFFALHTGSVWPWRLHVYFDLPIFLAMLLGVLLHWAYHSKVKLFAAFLEETLPPSILIARERLLAKVSKNID